MLPQLMLPQKMFTESLWKYYQEKGKFANCKLHLCDNSISTKILSRFYGN